MHRRRAGFPPRRAGRAPRRAARRARPAAADGRGRHGQARRRRAQRLVRHRPDLLYPEEGDTAADDRKTAPIVRSATTNSSPGWAKSCIAALNENTADGFVFRVDMRLRPYGDSGPLAWQLRHAGKLSADPGPAVGALRLDQGAPAHRQPSRRTGRHPAALRVPQIPRFRRLRLDARPARADPPRSRAPRDGAQHQAGAGRHPRNRVHRPGVPAHPRRPDRRAAAARRR